MCILILKMPKIINKNKITRYLIEILRNYPHGVHQAQLIREMGISAVIVRNLFHGNNLLQQYVRMRKRGPQRKIYYHIDYWSENNE